MRNVSSTRPESVYFTDPDGNELEVYCDTPPEHSSKMPNPYSGMTKLDFAPDDPGLGDVFAAPTG
jgi:catechol-2,3-dioxygenase